MAREGNSFTITWMVENANLWLDRECWNLDELHSPEFTVNTIGGVRWRLKLVSNILVRSNIAFFLLRESEDAGPKEVTLDLELSFLGKDESCLKSGEFTKITFSRDAVSLPLTVERNQVFEQKGGLFLSQDILVVRCRMSNIQVPESISEECIARTRLEVQREIIDVTLEDFSALVPGQKRSLHVRAKSVQCSRFSINILLGKHDKIGILGRIGDRTLTRPCTTTLFLVDSRGNKSKCGQDINWYRVSNFYHPIHLTKAELMANKRHYFPNKVLTLELEITFPSGILSEGIDKPKYKFDSYQNISALTPDLENLSNSQTVEERYELPSTLKNDLMSLHKDQMFCDTKIRTEAETFPAHKSVLCARSPVFTAMFTTDMKEKASDFIDIKDLSSDTVRRMLLFLYTDAVEGLKWETAQDLYIAADKYEIISLRQRCESFLKKNFCVSNICEILILADVHRNSDLKKSVQHYILKHDAEVFRSEEWKSFIRNHGKLAAETMCLKYG